MWALYKKLKEVIEGSAGKIVDVKGDEYKPVMLEPPDIGWTFEEHSDAIDALAVHPNGGKLYSGSWDDTVKEIDTSDGSEGWTFEGHSSFVYALAIHPDGNKLYSGSDDDTVKEITILYEIIGYQTVS